MARLSLVLVALIVAICAAAALPGRAHPLGSVSCVVNTTFPFRLPLSALPSHYDLFIAPSIPGYTSFYGSVNITLSVVVPTTCIVVNNWGLNFTSVLLQLGAKSFAPVSSVYSAYYQTHVLDFGMLLPQDQSIQLFIEFTGSIQTNATGFFKSAGDYPAEALQLSDAEVAQAAVTWRMRGRRGRPVTPSRTVVPFNTSLVMLATQFESSYARMAFPSFDEPSFKATFAASFLVPSNRNLTVLFNTPQVSVTPAPNSAQIVSFATTPHPMSSYLVAYCIGQFDYVQTESNGLTFRVYTPPGKSSYGLYALNVTVETINYFGSVWRFPFPFPKVDAIAVPAIVQDAMENWGLLTYDPNFLLIAPNTSFNQQQLVTEVITHELSHQWFGDIITMPWFSQMYLNEGFARYLQYVMTNELYPEWNVWTNGPDFVAFLQFAYSMIEEDALGLLPGCVVPDALYDGNPWQSTYLSPDWEQLFYGKGAAVNRMFALYLGSDWIKGLQTQIAAHQYTNPTVTDLMQSLTEANATAGPSMLPWLTEPSFPVVTLRYNPIDKRLHASQTPCSPLSNATWFVPLEVQVDDKLYTIYLNETESSFDLGLTSAPSLIYGNPNYTAYAVVTYPPTQWPSVLGASFVATLNESMQLQLAQALYVLARMSHKTILSGFVNLAVALNKLGSQSAVVWPYLISHIQTLTTPLAPYTSAWRPIAVSFYTALTPLATELGWAKPPQLPQFSAVQRQQILATCVAFGGCIESAAAEYNSVNGNFSALPNFAWQPVLLGQVLYNFSNSEAVLFAQLKAAAHGSNAANALESALASAPSVQACQTLLTYVATQRRSAAAQLLLLQTMLQNPTCRQIAWVEFTKVAPKILQADSTQGQAVLNTFSGVFASQEELHDAETFVTKYGEYFLSWQTSTALNTIRFNIELVRMNGA